MSIMRYFTFILAVLAWSCTAPARAAISGTGGIGGTPPPTNTIRYWAISPEATKDIQAYAVNLAYQQYGTNLNDNGQADRLGAQLSETYLAVGRTSVVDVAWYDKGQNVTSGDRSFTLRGKMGYHTNTVWATNGLNFPGANKNALEFYGLTNVSPYCSFLIEIAKTTNQLAGGDQHLWSLSNTAGHSTGLRLQLYYQFTTLYPYTRDTVYTVADGLFSKLDWAPSAGQGAKVGDEQTRTILITSDGTNIFSYVDGRLCSADTAGNQNYSGACNRMTFGLRSDSASVLQGTIRSWAWFNRVLNSNECYQVNQAWRVAWEPTECVILGDSLSEANEAYPSRDWPMEMWHSLGQPEDLRIFNYGFSGRTTATINTDATNTLVLHRPQSRFQNCHAFILAGKNDILNGGTVASAVEGVSNLCVFARSMGYKVHLLTDLPIGTAAVGYTAGKAANVLACNAYYRQAMLAVPPLANWLWDTEVLISNPNDVLQLYDGTHPTLGKKQAMGALVAAGRALWFP